MRVGATEASARMFLAPIREGDKKTSRNPLSRCKQGFPSSWPFGQRRSNETCWTSKWSKWLSGAPQGNSKASKNVPSSQSFDPSQQKENQAAKRWNTRSKFSPCCVQKKGAWPKSFGHRLLGCSTPESLTETNVHAIAHEQGPHCP